jgi:hypothetical protein
VHAEHAIASRPQRCYNQPMDPFIRLSIWLWQLSRRRLSRQDLLVYAIAIILALGIGLIEWSGYWPDGWKAQRTGMPKVTPI